MGSKGSKRNSILVQGSILAIASMVSRIIGLIYRIPLTNIIGKTGNDCYGTAFNIYNIVLIVSSFSIPLAVSKIVSARMAVNEVENVRRSLIGSLIFAFVSGSIGMWVLWIGADWFTSILKTPLAAPALRVLAPVILIVAIVGVLRGFFQGMRTMIPSAISQIFEQIVNAVVSVVAAYFLFKYGMKAGAVLNNPKLGPAYGAAGGTLGTAMGAVTALIFMVFIYLIYRRVFIRKIRRTRRQKVESYGTIFKILILTIVPVLLSTTVYNLFSITEMFIYKNVATLQGYNPNYVSDAWGVYLGEVTVLKSIPISIASSLAASSVPAIAAAFKKNEFEEVNHQITTTTRFISIIAFPSMVGLMVLAHPILLLLFHDKDALSATIMAIDMASIPFFCLSTLSNGLLQGINRMTEPVKNAAFTLLAEAVILLLLMEVFHMGIYGVMIANVSYGLIMSILNRLSLHRYSRAKQDIVKSYILPLIASVIMGVFVYLAYQLVHVLTGHNPLSTFFAIFVGVFAYFVAIIKIGGISENELRKFPKGYLLVNLARKMRLF